MRIAWVTDPHLDHCGSSTLNDFFKNLRDANPEIILLGGDYTQGNTFDYYVDMWTSKIKTPTFFVNGNHDYYFSSFEIIRKKSSNIPGMEYLSTGKIVSLDDDTALIGHDVWYDVRNGNPKSSFELTDFSAIKDLKHLYPKTLLVNKLRELGDEAAKYFIKILPRVLAKYKNIIVLTHVPPFVEACLYRGMPSSQDTLPFFSSQIVGNVLRDTMEKNPDRKMLVLSGHTHDEAFAQILPNLSIRVSRAFYGMPRFEIIEPLPF